MVGHADLILDVYSSSDAYLWKDKFLVTQELPLIPIRAEWQ